MLRTLRIARSAMEPDDDALAVAFALGGANNVGVGVPALENVGSGVTLFAVAREYEAGASGGGGAVCSICPLPALTLRWNGTGRCCAVVGASERGAVPE
jgi:hypothetical protein